MRRTLSRALSLCCLFIGSAQALFPQPLCAKFSETLQFASEEATFSGSSLDSIAQQFTHNMRPNAFQCCRNQEGFISGLKLRFATVQNAVRERNVPYFVADIPREVMTDCIGPDCATYCHNLVEIEAYPDADSPITALLFHKNNQYGWLQNISVQVGQESSTPICGGLDPVRETITKMSVESPIVGFMYSQTVDKIKTLQLVTNFCSLNGYSSYEVEIENFPEPLMIEFNQEYFLKRKLPLRPKIFTSVEYGIVLSTQVSCTYQIEGTYFTPRAPEYVKLIKENDGSNFIVIDSNVADWPTEPRHDRLTLTCNIGGSFFMSTRTIELVFFKFDYALAEEKNCFHYVKRPDANPVKPAIIKESMLYAGKFMNFICCVDTNGQVSELLSFGFIASTASKQGCRITRDVHLQKLTGFEIIMTSQDKVVDFQFKVGSGSERVSLCGTPRPSNPKKESIKMTDDGVFVAFDRDENNALLIVANKCQVTPHYAEFPQAQIVSSIQSYGGETIRLPDPTFEQLPSDSTLVPKVVDSEPSKVYQGWQDLKSLTGTPLWHAKNIASDVVPSGSEVLSLDETSKIKIVPYSVDLELAHPAFSYQIYKTFTYSSPLVEFQFNRLLAVIFMRETIMPRYEGDGLPEEVSIWDQDLQKACVLRVTGDPKPMNYFIEDDVESSQALIELAPTACDPALQEIFVENTLIVRIGRSRDLYDHFMDQISDEQFFFATEDPKYVNKTAVVTQKTEVYAIDPDTQLEVKVSSLSHQIAEVRIKSRCDELIVLPLYLSTMHAIIGSESVKKQTFRPLTDIQNVISQGYCGPVEMNLVQEGQAKQLPRSVLSIEGFSIQLSGAEAADLFGEYKVLLKFELPEVQKAFTFEFKVSLGWQETDFEEEIRAEINIPPGFDNFEPGVKAKLPSINLMVEQPYKYELPKIQDSNEKDKVNVEVRIADTQLADCECILVKDNKFLLIDLPAEYDGKSTQIAVILSDGKDDSWYYLQIRGKTYVPPPPPSQKPLPGQSQQSETDKVEDQQQQERKTTLFGQDILPQLVMSEDVDSEGEIEEQNAALQGNIINNCIPVFASASHDGQVTVQFVRKLEVTSKVENLNEQIVSSGSIQVQLIDEGFLHSRSYKAFKWTLSQPSPFKLQINVDFEDPGAISSNSNDLDKLRITFVDTSDFFRCESEYNSEQRRQLQKNFDQSDSSDLIPLGYKVVAELPPQATKDQLALQLKAIESVETPTKTVIFSSIAFSSVTGLSLQALWGSINALQIIAHAPLNSVNLPQNTYSFFQFLIKVASFDFYSPTDHADFGFTLTEPLSHQFNDFGYETSNFYENLGSIMLIAVLLALVLILVPLFIMIVGLIWQSTGSQRLQQKLKIRCSTVTNTWLRFGLYAFFELLICSFVGLRLRGVIYTDPTQGDYVAIASAYVFGGLCTLLLLFVLYMTTIHVRPLVKAKKVEISAKRQARENTVDQKTTTSEQKAHQGTTLPGNSTSQIPLQAPVPVVVETPREDHEDGQTEVSQKAVRECPEHNLAGSSQIYVKELFKSLKQHKMSAQLFYAIFLVRRVIFVVFAIYVSEQPFLQVYCYLIQSLAVSSYLAACQPFAEPIVCKNELFNEVVVLLVGYHMLMLMGPGLVTEESRSNIGLSVVYQIVAMCVLNCIKVVHDIVHRIILYYRRYSAIYRCQKNNLARGAKRESKTLEQLPTLTQATEEKSKEEEDDEESEISIENQGLDDAFNSVQEKSPSVVIDAAILEVEQLSNIDTERQLIEEEPKKVDSVILLESNSSCQSIHSSFFKVKPEDVQLQLGKGKPGQTGFTDLLQKSTKLDDLIVEEQRQELKRGKEPKPTDIDDRLSEEDSGDTDVNLHLDSNINQVNDLQDILHSAGGLTSTLGFGEAQSNELRFNERLRLKEEPGNFNSRRTQVFRQGSLLHYQKIQSNLRSVGRFASAQSSYLHEERLKKSETQKSFIDQRSGETKSSIASPNRMMQQVQANPRSRGFTIQLASMLASSHASPASGEHSKVQTPVTHNIQVDEENFDYEQTMTVDVEHAENIENMCQDTLTEKMDNSGREDISPNGVLPDLRRNFGDDLTKSHQNLS